MRFLKLTPIALIGRVFMMSLFVGTIWMASAGCWDDGHDHWHHDEHWDHEHDHDHDHDGDWH